MICISHDEVNASNYKQHSRHLFHLEWPLLQDALGHEGHRYRHCVGRNKGELLGVDA
jgi:hypothetical protein